MSYTVIKDSREKYGYVFNEYKECRGMEIGALKTGDYGIKELPDVVCIERKASPEELVMNLGSDIVRFEKELERMVDYKHKYLVLEFSATDLISFPENSKISNKNIVKVKMTGRYAIRALLELQLKYDFQIIFADDNENAFLIVASIIKRMWEKYGK